MERIDPLTVPTTNLRNWSEPIAFGVIDHQAVVRVVVGDVIVEAQRVLLGHLEAAVLEQRQRSRVRPVRVEHASRGAIGKMDARVDVEGGLFELALTLEYRPRGVEHQEIRSRDLAPVQPVAVQEKSRAVARLAWNHVAEVIADAFVQIEAHREAESRREVDPRRRNVQLVHRSHASIIVWR